MNDKQKKKKGLDDYIENAVSPSNNSYIRNDMLETTVFESHQSFSHDYNAKKYGKLSKGFNILFVAAIITLIGSLLFVSYSSRKLTVVYAYQDTVTAYEFNLGYSRKIIVDEVNFIGPYSGSKVYKGYHGKLAILAEAIQRYDADIVICDGEQIQELFQAKYLISVSRVLRDDVNAFSNNLGLEIGEEGFFGMKTSGGINIMLTDQLITFSKAEYIAFTKKINVLGSRRSVERFIKLYFDY